MINPKGIVQFNNIFQINHFEIHVCLSDCIIQNALLNLKTHSTLHNLKDKHVFQIMQFEIHFEI